MIIMDEDKRYKITLRDFCMLISLCGSELLTESKSGAEKGIKFRLDTPNGYGGQQRHIHVDQGKLHYAWNQDGSRSHVGSWPKKEPIMQVKQIAAKGLGIDISMLERCMDCMLISDPISSEKEQALFESVRGFKEAY